MVSGTYAASKRSLEIVAETLRLELAPFGVGVLEVVTGGVKINGQTYFGDFKLPSDSLYKSQEPLIASRAQGHDNLPRMETLEYAAAVVDEVNKRTTGRFWYGSAADWVRSSTTATAVPQADMVSCLLADRGVSRLLIEPMQDAGASMGCGLDALGK